MHIHPSPLNSRQLRFAEFFALSGNASDAARAAGYAAASAKVTASRLLTKDNVAAAVRDARRELEARMDVSRDRVLRELQRAIDVARRKGDAGSMIAGWREIGRICGYYAPERVTKIDVNIAAKRCIDRLETLSDASLLAMVAEGEPARM
jgi:hypothetical protein